MREYACFPSSSISSSSSSCSNKKHKRMQVASPCTLSPPLLPCPERYARIPDPSPHRSGPMSIRLSSPAVFFFADPILLAVFLPPLAFLNPDGYLAFLPDQYPEIASASTLPRPPLFPQISGPPRRQPSSSTNDTTPPTYILIITTQSSSSSSSTAAASSSPPSSRSSSPSE